MSMDEGAKTHVWYSPAECAALLDGTKHGDQWRARCPAHKAENPQTLAIAEGKDRYGHPMTLLHCFVFECPIEDICAAMGIEVRNLFCIHPDYARATRNQPRSHSQRVAKLRKGQEPATSDEIAQMLLEEMIVSDPQWIQECQPARQKMWELAQASPQTREAFTRALREVRITPAPFWETLASEQKG